MAKNVVEPAVQAARERLEAKRAELIQKMADGKTLVTDRLRLFLDVDAAIEKLEKLESRQNKQPVGLHGPKVHEG